MIAFKLDENLPRECAEILRSAGHDAVTVGEEQLGGRPDEDIAAACREERRAVVTFDLHFANVTKHPPASHDGIVVLRLARQDKPYVLEIMRRLVPLLDESSVKGHLWIVEDTAIRIRG